MLTVYGIKQCDTCRKALKWLTQHEYPFRFHDLRVDGFDAAILDRWLETATLTELLNRRSTTWRQLSDAQRNDEGDAHRRNLLLQNPTLVRRPVFFRSRVLAIGFKLDRLARLLA